MLRQARRPFSSVQGGQERPAPWTEQPDLYRPRQETRRRSPERNTETSRYRPIRSQPLKHDFDRYGPSGYSQRRRQPSPSPAPTSSRTYRSQGSRTATNDNIRSHHDYYRGNRPMTREIEKEIEQERARERQAARNRRDVSRERRRREEEYGRGRRDRSSDHGGGRRRSRASRFLDGLERLLKW
ncbi:hypothetical protein QBC45DRAFT_381319 [Copromyces sp. CBS 386.78]|nr:hypothetical protein QBC45DRAFT_381319 [Copromyces sp. CBS 386.78]